MRGRGRPALDLQQVLRAPKRVAQDAVRLVESRGQLEAGALFGGGSELVVVGVDLPALAQVIRLDLVRIDGEAPRQAEHLEVGGVLHRRPPCLARRASEERKTLAGASG